MSYKVLSRKWRPQVFHDIIGQKHITKTLENAINLNRVAHGYLFFGPRGVGKTTCARILSKALNCLDLNESNPCNKCINCKQILDGSSLDVLEIDGASNRGIDEIRELREAVKYTPSSGKYRIYIIDEVHMLTQQAFNALLKTLEEPPSHVKFIMATTEINKVPQTILSRTMRFNFHRIKPDLISNHLKKILETENITYDPNSINLIANKSDGSLRDSLSYLDQVISYSDNDIQISIVKDVLGIIEESIYLNLLINCHDNNNSMVIEICSQLFEAGVPIIDCIKGWNDFLRNIILLKSNCIDQITLSKNSVESINENLNNYSYIHFLKILNFSLEFESNINKIDQIEIAFELLMLKISSLNAKYKKKTMSNSVDFEEKDEVSKNTNSENLNKIKNNDNYEIQSVPKIDIIEKQKNTIEEQKIQKNISKIDSNKDNQKDFHNSIATENVGETKLNNSSTDNNVIEKSSLNSDKRTDNIDLKFFLKRWDELVNTIEGTDSKLSIFLEDAIPKEYKNNILNIVLPDGNVFQATNLQKNVNILEDYINEKYGIKLKINFSSKEKDKKEFKDNPLKNDHPLISDAIEMFNGEIIK
tara:strand:+ start:1400 stop:3169 length:1770 start_codon:yes stop_codon:yes gene_type:complete